MLRRWLPACLLTVLAALPPVAAQADPVRIAVFNAGLAREGPGLLLRDILAGDDPQVAAAAAIIGAARPDVLLLLGFDHDAEHRALTAFRAVLRADGLDYPYSFAPVQNAGLPSGLDLDGDGRLRGPADAFGFGEFRGQGGMAILSRRPLEAGAARDFSPVLWRDLDAPDLPVHADGTPFPSERAQAAMRLSSVGHWDVPVNLPGGRQVHLLASYHSPPVFDGPEDINGKRNRDELRFWRQYLGGQAFRDAAGRATAFAGGSYVLLAGLNADPEDGDGARETLRGMLAGGLFRDPAPSSDGGAVAAAQQGGINATQSGDPARDTADWRDTDGQPGNLRVDYVLPSPDLTVRGAGVFWPAPGRAQAELVASGQSLGIRHRLVWVDLE